MKRETILVLGLVLILSMAVLSSEGRKLKCCKKYFLKHHKNDSLRPKNAKTGHRCRPCRPNIPLPSS